MNSARIRLAEGKGGISKRLGRDLNEEYDIVLASASPRRRQLLEEAGIHFRVHAVDVDESLSPELVAEPVEAVKRLAERKARAAVEELLVPDYEGTLVVVGSDTMVVLRG